MALGVYQNSVFDGGGMAIPFLSILVTESATGDPATIYADENGGSPLVSLQTDISGYFKFAAAGGLYDITFGTDEFAPTWPQVPIGTFQAEDFNRDWRGAGEEDLDGAISAVAPIRKTASEWAADTTTVLAPGQRGQETDANREKVGNEAGELWGVLLYTGGSGLSIDADLEDGSASIAPAVSTVIIIGTADGDVTYTLADGVAIGQQVEFVVRGNPDIHTISIVSGVDPLIEHVEDAPTSTRYTLQWTGSEWQLIESGSVAPLGPFAFAQTINGGQITLDDAGTDQTFDDAQEAISLLFSLVAAAGGAPSPAIVTSNATPFEMKAAMRASANVVLASHQVAVDFEVPANAAAGTFYTIRADHNGCFVSNVGGAGTVTGTVSLIKGRIHAVHVAANAATAPQTVVYGGAVPSISVNSARTYTAEDADGTFELIASAGNQTMPTAASVPSGWLATIINRSGGTINIVGADATHALPDDGVFNTEKLGASLVGYGTGAATIVDLDVA